MLAPPLPSPEARQPFTPWNRGKAAGKKIAFSEEEVRVIRARLEAGRHYGPVAFRDLVLLSIGLDSMLRASDLLTLTVGDVLDSDGEVPASLTVRQKKTGRPVRIELQDQTRRHVRTWVTDIDGGPRLRSEPLFPGRDPGRALSRIQYSRIVKGWARMVGQRTDSFSTHSLRRTQATALYRRTGNMLACMVLLGQTKVATTQEYLDASAEAALELARRHRI